MHNDTNERPSGRSGVPVVHDLKMSQASDGRWFIDEVGFIHITWPQPSPATPRVPHRSPGASRRVVKAQAVTVPESSASMLNSWVRRCQPSKLTMRRMTARTASTWSASNSGRSFRDSGAERLGHVGVACRDPGQAGFGRPVQADRSQRLAQHTEFGERTPVRLDGIGHLLHVRLHLDHPQLFHSLVCLGADAVDERVFGLEVVVDRPQRHPSPLGDGGHRQTLQPRFDDLCRRRIDDARSGQTLLLFPQCLCHAHHANQIYFLHKTCKQYIFRAAKPDRVRDRRPATWAPTRSGR